MYAAIAEAYNQTGPATGVEVVEVPSKDDHLALLQTSFAAGDARSGSGLGLAICHEIVTSLGGSIRLVNREAGGRVEGMDATVELPLAQNDDR